MKYKNQTTSKFKSKFEEFAFKRLTEEGIEFSYEPFKIELQPKVKLSKVITYEKKRKVFTQVSQSLRDITYTPDFVGKNWIIETKGVRTPDFNIK